LTVDTHVLGDGCAAMMLASNAGNLANHNITVVHPDGAPEPKDHMLGFWATPSLEFAKKHARGSWSSWAVITDTVNVTMRSENQAYHAMNKLPFLEHCRSEAVNQGVRFVDEQQHRASTPDLIFDTRPPRTPHNAMLQHFLGLEVEVDRPVFDPSTAVLMDFRVDQSNGMHFMYVLPFSPTRALVESTFFSTQVLEREHYVEAIEAYLFDHYGAKISDVLHEEQGVIPMGTLLPHDPNIPGLGANGGAIRPASGYTFAFINEQIQNAVFGVNNGRKLAFSRPHKRVDVWMDGVLLSVLRHWPNQGPQLFGRMAKALSGDEFIRFMSGRANWRLRFKVMMAMPKMPFIRGVSKLVFSRPSKVVT
tara:strand:- start:998 stop:2086 length:1089 start_codon:yes stop_codon:yes gene_type:complete